MGAAWLVCCCPNTSTLTHVSVTSHLPASWCFLIFFFFCFVSSGLQGQFAHGACSVGSMYHVLRTRRGPSCPSQTTFWGT